MTEATGDKASLTAEDARLIAAAANDGRISVDNVLTWVNAMRADREGTRRTLASLVPVLADMRRAAGVDPEVEEVHSNVMGRLGIKPTPTAPRTVAAAGHGPAVTVGGATPPQPAPVARLDAHGFPMPDIPAPVVIQKGTSPADWTPRQAQDAMLRRLGPRFFPGTQAPPPGDVVYMPSPNDVSRFDESTGKWIEKQPFKEIP